jgi:putative ribosome biogenesis GTPase RsgA
MREINNLDFEKLNNLMDKNDNAKELVKGKDLVIFLGDTGTGKSTTIHYLAGSKMRKVKFNGIDHIEPEIIRN